jgi:hypothetical protein
MSLSGEKTGEASREQDSEAGPALGLIVYYGHASKSE